LERSRITALEQWQAVALHHECAAALTAINKLDHCPCLPVCARYRPKLPRPTVHVPGNAVDSQCGRNPAGRAPDSGVPALNGHPHACRLRAPRIPMPEHTIGRARRPWRAASTPALAQGGPASSADQAAVPPAAVEHIPVAEAALKSAPGKGRHRSAFFFSGSVLPPCWPRQGT
jgi:hypothetical protein